MLEVLAWLSGAAETLCALLQTWIETRLRIYRDMRIINIEALLHCQTGIWKGP